MKEKVKGKLRSRAGESIGETLISLLISALALVMLAGAVSSAADIVKRSKKAMDQYYDANAKIVASEGEQFGIEDLKLGPYGMPDVNCYQNSSLGDTSVIVYTAEFEEDGAE